MEKKEGKVAQAAVVENFMWPVTRIEVEPQMLHLIQPYINEIIEKIDNLRDFQKQWLKDKSVIRKNQHETFWHTITMAIDDGVQGLVQVDGDILLINFPACYQQYDKRFRAAEGTYPMVSYQYLFILLHDMNDAISVDVPEPYTTKFTISRMSVKFAENGSNE